MGKDKSELLEAIAKLSADVAGNKAGQADALSFIFQQPGSVLGISEGQLARVGELAGRWPWPAEVSKHAAEGLLENVMRDAVIEAARVEPGKRAARAAEVLAEKERVMAENVGDHVFLFE